jgi:hypothetical protein
MCPCPTRLLSSTATSLPQHVCLLIARGLPPALPWLPGDAGHLRFLSGRNKLRRPRPRGASKFSYYNLPVHLVSCPFSIVMAPLPLRKRSFAFFLVVTGFRRPRPPGAGVSRDAATAAQRKRDGRAPQAPARAREAGTRKRKRGRANPERRARPLGKDSLRRLRSFCGLGISRSCGPPAGWEPGLRESETARQLATCFRLVVLAGRAWRGGPRDEPGRHSGSSHHFGALRPRGPRTVPLMCALSRARPGGGPGGLALLLSRSVRSRGREYNAPGPAGGRARRRPRERGAR